MSISRMQEVELSPRQWTSRLRCGVHSIRLHAANVSRQNNISLWVLTAFAGECHSAQSGEEESGRSPMHREKFTVACTKPMPRVAVGSGEVYLFPQHGRCRRLGDRLCVIFPSSPPSLPCHWASQKRYLGARGHKRG